MAKLYNITSEINNGWINTDINEIYKCARISARSSEEKDLIIHELLQDGYLECSKKNTNLNLRVTFVDDESDVVLKITTLEELGYEYMNYTSLKNKFCRCQICGKLVKLNSKDRNKKYCKDCAVQVDKDKAKQRMFDLRHT